MTKEIILFDVDGTLVESSQKITETNANILNKLKEKGYEIGIVGGGNLTKILNQMDDLIYFHHYFTECGCVYHQNKSTNINVLDLEIKYMKNIREHLLYLEINKLVKKALEFISQVDYTITGNFIDLRNGIIYISLIGMSATNSERQYFIEIDNKEKIRKKLIDLLIKESIKLKIDDKISILQGGSVGISIYPNEYDKIQVLEHLTNYDNIYYFGDKYLEDGNDYKLLNDDKITRGFSINNPEETFEILKNKFI